MRKLINIVCVFLLIWINIYATVDVTDDEIMTKSKKLFKWIRERDGGYVNDKLEYRRAILGDEKSSFGLFARESIKKNDFLLKIPPDCFITGGKPVEEPQALECSTVNSLVREFKKGHNSFYSTYLDLLKYDNPRVLPSGWSNIGKGALLQLIGLYDSARMVAIPPQDPIDWIEGEWVEECDGSAEDELKVNSALWVVKNGWGDILVPVFDLINHRNGKYTNTETSSVMYGKTLKVKASRNIKKGEEIYTSLNNCTDCYEDRMDEYGTFEFLRDSGFVEKFPQRWIFSRNLAFELDEVTDKKGVGTGELKLEWISGIPSEESLKFLQHHLRRLTGLDMIELLTVYSDLPMSEYELLTEFHESLLSAVSFAIDTLGSCESDSENCNPSLAHYDKLEEEDDNVDYFSHTCNVSKFYNETGWHGYERVDEFHSHYQYAEYIMDPSNNTIGFELDGTTLQIATSYRPQYHEMFVHYAARYLKQVKRAVFVGGGDSMLLHELLKYPELELVLGLEIDQKVVRHTFKNMGTQPHWDNEKVQWWFGDAAESLRMIPKEYSGSFDLVLVDMSETAAARTVTEHLNIWDALGLLLKEDGIYVQNEYYIQRISQIFDYSIQIHFYGVPAICSQTFSLGSNKVDFLYSELFHHEMDNLYIKPINQLKHRYELLHDYRKDTIREQRHCKNSPVSDKELEEQTESPGIIMIIEAEDIPEDLQTDFVKTSLMNKLNEEAGLSVVSTFVEEVNDERKSIITVILREGYIIARFWPADKYCAFDIHLWSSFGKHDTVKNIALAVVSSKSFSSYRIVAGGMFGVNTWKEDQQNRGPRFTHFCDRQAGKSRDKEIAPETLSTITTEVLSVIEGHGLLAAVICGENEDFCQSYLALKEVDEISEVIPITTCPEISLDPNQCGASEIGQCTEASSASLFACEQSLAKSLQYSVNHENKIRVIILDPSAPKHMAQVILRTLKNKKNKKQLVTDDLFVLAIMTNDETWKRNWLERFRSDVIVNDPVSRIEVLFNSTDSSVEMGITSSGDEDFARNIIETISDIKYRTGLTSDVRNLYGGKWKYQVDFEPEYYFNSQDYDQTEALAQWSAQVPKGFQTVFQLGLQADVSNVEVKDVLKSTLNDIPSSVSKIQGFNDLGDGSLLASVFSDGNVVVVWDGRRHIDINLFTYSENVEFYDKFVKDFMLHLKSKSTPSKIVLRDEQPRGFGRVVNTKADIDSVEVPLWAKPVELKRETEDVELV